MLNEWDRYHVDQTTADRTIFVDNRVTTVVDGQARQIPITATDFHLTAELQQQLFLNGATAATDFVIAKAAAGGLLHPGRGRLTPGPLISEGGTNSRHWTVTNEQPLPQGSRLIGLFGLSATRLATPPPADSPPPRGHRAVR